MTPEIAIIHASRGRPQKAVEAMLEWQARAARPGEIEYFICLDPDDKKTISKIRIPQTKFAMAAMVETKSKGSAPAWDFGSKFSRAPLIVQMSDDMEPPKDWDWILLDRLEAVGGEHWKDHKLIVNVGDGFRKDRLMTTIIMTRLYMQFRGSFIPPEYQSVYSDDEVTYRAYRDQRDGNVRVIEARDVIFFHRHHYHDKRVPFDETYDWQNRPLAYDNGAKLFNERNPDAHGKDANIWQ